MGEPRPFQESDLSAVCELIHRTIDVCYPAAYPSRAVAFFKKFHSAEALRDRAKAGDVVVVERDGRVVATGALLDDEVSAVFVEPELHGSGLGTAVMDELEALAAGRGREVVHLSVSLPSKGFYARRGYRMLEERSIDVGEGQHLQYWHAEKSLRRES